MDSNNLEKNEFVCCEFEIACKPSLEESKKESNAYCGRIFVSVKKDFVFMCTFCKALFTKIKEFKSHMKHHWSNMKWNIENFDYDNDPFQNIKAEKNDTIVNYTNREESIHCTDKIISSYQEVHKVNDKQNMDKNPEFLVHINNYDDSKNKPECVTKNTNLSKIHDKEQNTKTNNTIVEKTKNTHEFSLDIDTNTNDGSFQFDSDISFLSDDNDDHSETQATKKNLTNGSTKLNNKICDENVCSEEQIQNHNLVDHCETNFVSSTNPNIICDICNASFSTKENFETHLSVCCAKFENNAIEMELTLQKKSCEGNVFAESLDLNPCVCRFCYQQFRTPLKRRKHELIHTGELTCKICKKMFRSKKQFDIHAMIHTEMNPFKCKICDNTYSNKDNLNRHMIRHGPTLYKCEYCDREFFRLSEKKCHVKIKHFAKKISCEICSKTFSTKRMLSIHNSKHNIKKCKICGVILRNDITLRNHIKRHGERKYKCDYCDKKFATSGEKKYHERIHTGEKPYECNHCPKRFISKSVLTKHLVVHNNKRDHLCSECGFAFNTRENLERHLKLHKIEKPTSYDCSICQIKYNRKTNLVNHMKTHSNTKYSCAECGKVFTYPIGLTHHMKTHLNIEYSCAECDRVFTHPGALAQHMKIHKREQQNISIVKDSNTNKIKYLCPECGFAFTNYSNMLRHLKLHKNGKPFRYDCNICTECDRVFKNPGALAMHMKKHKREQQN